MAELTRDIAQYLIANGLAAAIGTDIFLDTRLDSPDNVVCIFEYAGAPTTAGIEALNRRIQILVRNKSYAAARSKIWAIFDLLDDPLKRDKQISETRWAAIQAIQTPFKLETDAKMRAVFVCNFAVITARD